MCKKLKLQYYTSAFTSNITLNFASLSLTSPGLIRIKEKYKIYKYWLFRLKKNPPGSPYSISYLLLIFITFYVTGNFSHGSYTVSTPFAHFILTAALKAGGGACFVLSFYVVLRRDKQRWIRFCAVTNIAELDSSPW